MKKLFSCPSNKIIIRYGLVTIIVVLIIAYSIPYLLNYPPESINTAFDIEMSYVSYNVQIGCICIVGLLFTSIFIKIVFRSIDKWYELPLEHKHKDKDLIIALRRKCFRLPYLLFFFELFIPVIVSILVLFLTGSHHYIMIYKILFLIISFSLLLAVASYVFSKDLYAEILSSTYSKDLEAGSRVSIYMKLFLQILPVGLVLLLVTSLIGYSKAVVEKEEILFNFYHKSLIETFDLTKHNYTEEQITQLLNNINTNGYNNHYWFIIKPNNEVTSSNNAKISDFIVKYTQQISSKYNGKTYDSYGMDTQGSTICINNYDGIWYVGILYDITATIALKYIIIDFIFMLILTIILLHIFSKSFSKDLSIISNGLKEISTNNNPDTYTYLPVTSNDEFGDLVSSFNKIQDLTKANIEQIHNNQDMLVEKERLASLRSNDWWNCSQLKNTYNVYSWCY